jgi:hypothetical protein
MKQVQANKQWVNSFNNIKSKLEETEILYDFYQDGEGSEDYFSI